MHMVKQSGAASMLAHKTFGQSYGWANNFAAECFSLLRRVSDPFQIRGGVKSKSLVLLRSVKGYGSKFF